MSTVEICEYRQRDPYGRIVRHDAYAMRDHIADEDDIISTESYLLPDGFDVSDDQGGVPRIYKDGVSLPCEIDRAPEGGIAVLYGVGTDDYIVLDEIASSVE